MSFCGFVWIDKIFSKRILFFYIGFMSRVRFDKKKIFDGWKIIVGRR